MKIKIKSVLETLAKMSEEIEQCFNAGVVDGFTKEFLPQIPPYILRLIIYRISLKSFGALRMETKLENLHQQARTRCGYCYFGCIQI